jgi:hypothetical protein
MAAEDVADVPAGSEVRQPVKAGGERLDVADVQAARVHGVPGEQEPGARVVDGDGRGVVAGRASDLQLAPAEVEGHDLGRPPGKAEVALDSVELTVDHGGVRAVGEPGVARHVIAVPVRVRDDERVPRRGAAAVEQGVHRLPQPAVRHRPGIQHQRPLAAAEQVDERCLVVQVLALPQDERVVIDAQHLHLGVGGPAGGRPVNPSHAGQRVVAARLPRHLSRVVGHCRSIDRTCYQQPSRP